MPRKLGRRSIKTDARTLRLSKYLTALPPAPVDRNWLRGVTEWGMMLNDNLGDCTCAACGHAIQIWTLNTGAEQTVYDAAILTAYEEWCGYNPADPGSDQGGIILDVLNDWRQHGEVLQGNKLSAFASVNVANPGEVRQAINLFGGVYIGLGLPVTAQTQTSWSYVPSTPDNAAGSWGGHAVYVPKYSAAGLTCITWGEAMWMSNHFWHEYVDECYALLSEDWLNTRGAQSPSGFDLAQLQADLAAIR